MANDFLVLKERTDFQKLVDQGFEESLTLDFKASPALTRDSKAIDEMCKDVSALANSAGGKIIYGIEEDRATEKRLVVDDGVADPKITRGMDCPSPKFTRSPALRPGRQHPSAADTRVRGSKFKCLLAKVGGNDLLRAASLAGHESPRRDPND